MTTATRNREDHPRRSHPQLTGEPRKRPRISGVLRSELQAQRAEMFARTLPDYPEHERLALERLSSSDSDPRLLRAAFRRWWLDHDEELRDNWITTAASDVPRIATQIAAELADLKALPSWITENLLRETVAVLQVRELHQIRASHALAALRAIGDIAVMGVKL